MKATLNDLVEAELAKRWYEQSSPELRKLYNQKREIPRKRDSRLTMWAAIIIYVLFAGLDVFMLPDVAFRTTAGRLVLGLISLAVVEYLIRRNARAEIIDAACGTIVVAGYLSWLLQASFSGHTTALSYYMIFGAIFIMVANLFFNFRFWYAVLSSATVLISCIIATFILVSVDMTYQVAFLTFYVSSFAATVYVNWKLNSERYSVFLNAIHAEMRQDEVEERGEALLRLSKTDALTGLENRRAIDEKLRHHWDEWQKTGRRFAAILIDVDFFKKYNDYYGHQEGDRCLILVANALGGLMQQHHGSIGRFGGEEFIVLVHLQEDEEVAQLAETIRRAIEDLRLVHEQRPDGESVVTVSVGAAFSKNVIGEKLERLITEADRALYRAKAGGRNCAWVFDQNDPYGDDDSEDVAALLRTAIADGLVSLVYQPIRNIASDRIEAAEALMRLTRPDGRMIPPNIFIPVAERTGAISELGRWAIRTACLELIATNLVPVVSVNVSAVQLKTPGFAISVATILGETRVAADRLAFEITEGREIETHPDVLRCIGELKQLGVKIWLDDFGTGFAGLSCLRAIDFDTVKIDRSFLHDSPHPKGAIMLQDIIRLIANRGHRMVIEGVETERQLQLMKSYGIDFVQGFHIGRPAAVENFHAHLNSHSPQAAPLPASPGPELDALRPSSCTMTVSRPVVRRRTARGSSGRSG